MNEELIDSVLLNFDSRSQWTLNIVLAFVMFGIALEISIDDFKRVVKNPKAIFIGVVCQFVLLPALTFLLVYTLEPIASIAMGMFMVAACPGGNVSNFITHLAGGDTALSISMTAGMLLWSLFCLWGNEQLSHLVIGGNPIALWQSSLFLFVLAWIGQFIGHKIEGEKPSFFEDLQFLMIGPAWLMSFIYKKVGISL